MGTLTCAECMNIFAVPTFTIRFVEGIYLKMIPGLQLGMIVWDVHIVMS